MFQPHRNKAQRNLIDTLTFVQIVFVISSGSRGARGSCPPRPVKISHKKMATKGGCIDFMFLAAPLYPAAGSATGHS